MDHEWLTLAQQAYQDHDRARAHELLTGYVRMHSQDAEGWFWLAQCTEDVRERNQYLHQALALNPHHAAARTELAATRRPSSEVSARGSSTALHGKFSLGKFASMGLFGISLLLALLVALAVIPMFVGLRSFVIMSGSMEPTISTGSVAFAQPVPSQELQIGDVIAFNPHPDAVMPTIHRVIKIEDRKGTRYYTTRGDSNNGDDAEMALPPQSLQVVGALPVIGYLVFYAAQPIGTVLLVVVPLLLLALLWIKDRIFGARHAQLA